MKKAPQSGDVIEMMDGTIGMIMGETRIVTEPALDLTNPNSMPRDVREHLVLVGTEKLWCRKLTSGRWSNWSDMNPFAKHRVSMKDFEDSQKKILDTLDRAMISLEESVERMNKVFKRKK